MKAFKTSSILLTAITSIGLITPTVLTIHNSQQQVSAAEQATINPAKDDANTTPSLNTAKALNSRDYANNGIMTTTNVVAGE
ncbi:hypothetical protein [Lacticaseibacillus jixiensis]|uniref:hypothetical protein n=1 Tax=Lacticaseibacillus jixiensis TaxID=3231926 RepID=UPI0036F2AF4B